MTMTPSMQEYVEVQHPESVSSEDSEYGSMPASALLPEVVFAPAHLKFLNQRLSMLEPEDILRWCLITLPGLHQTTALGLTGNSHPTHTHTPPFFLYQGGRLIFFCRFGDNRYAFAIIA